jgi:glutaredoxin 3
MAKEFLSQRGVPFTDYDVAVDREKAQEMVQKSGQMGVPVIVVDNEVIIGFNRKRLEELLAQQQAGGSPSAPGAWKPTLGAKISDADYAIPGTVGGAYIGGVNSGSSAEAAGLQQGDIIFEMNGKKINSANDVIDIIRAAKQGDSVPVVITRGDQPVKLTLTFK